MGFFDDEGSMNASSGAAVGFAYGGPIGAAFGAAAGLAMGSLTGSGRERRRIERKNIELSYEIGEQFTAEQNKTRESINKTYTQKIGQARAKFAGSGTSLEGSSWDQTVGGIAAERDKGLSQLSEQQTAFEKSPAYEFIKMDYSKKANERVGGRTGKGSEGDPYVYASAPGGTWVTRGKGEREYIQPLTPEAKAYPKFDEYLKGRLAPAGSDERLAFESTLSENTAKELKAFERAAAIDKYSRQQATKFDNMRGK